MNVTRENMAEAAAQIEALLPSAAFVAFDEEMTGISVQGQAEQIQDLPSRRYTKMRNVASRYSIIQFGICLFHEEENGSGYLARPYNFYLFPESGAVLMEGSSICFLRDHKMDFNKWIYEGIPFVNKEGARRLHSSLLPESTGQNGSGGGEKRTPMVLSKKSDIELTDKAIAGVREWLADEKRKEETEYEVLTTNPFLRRFLYESVAANFPELMAESRPVPGVKGRSAFVVLRLSAEQKAEREAKARAEKEKEYAQKIGFLRVFKALSEAKKPLIGHNCMYDLLFMMSHFEAPLPKSYETFREVLQNRFPLLLDTKLLATREPFKFKPLAPGGPPEEGKPAPQREQRFGSTALGELFKVLQEEASGAKEAGGVPAVEVRFAPAFDRYALDASAAHEAGYDAYMTGYVFAQMAKEALRPERVAALGNRTPMFRSLFDFNLAGGDESKIHSGAYVHVSGLTGWDVAKTREVFAEIKAPGGTAPASVQIFWIDDDSAFFVLPTECSEALAAKLERSRTESGLTLTPGEEWFAEQAQSDVWGAEEAAAEGAPPAKRART
mmetsp:Transcript_102272/g.305372  ORF Transcript_102272/g.305372 Transcript_102272/m.305372 type:complete len:555 (-) Transcript_102272:70-1734(-)